MTAHTSPYRCAALRTNCGAQLPLEIESCEFEPLECKLSAHHTRLTPVIHLRGACEEGLGEDVTPGVRPLRQASTITLHGGWTLESFAARLDTLELFPTPPPHPALKAFRRWALESAALDRALTQAGRSLAHVLGRDPQPVRFVNSITLTDDPPTIEPIRRRLERQPQLRFKLDPTGVWTDELIAKLAATGAVEILHLKGQCPPHAPVAQPPDPKTYARIATAFPTAWIEDPALTPSTEAILHPHHRRITWDAPIRSVQDIQQLPFAPAALNIKPGRIGTLRALLDVYEHCASHGISTYGGGMFELGPDRGQLQYLASIFHPSAPNDVAPPAYNQTELPHEAPLSPLSGIVSLTGFRAASPQPHMSITN